MKKYNLYYSESRIQLICLVTSILIFTSSTLLCIYLVVTLDLEKYMLVILVIFNLAAFIFSLGVVLSNFVDIPCQIVLNETHIQLNLLKKSNFYTFETLKVSFNNVKIKKLNTSTKGMYIALKLSNDIRKIITLYPRLNENEFTTLVKVIEENCSRH